MNKNLYEFGAAVGAHIQLPRMNKQAINMGAVGRGVGRAVNSAASYLGNQARGAGIQAGRAMNRLSTAAQPLMNEAQQLGSTAANKINKTMTANPALTTGLVAGGTAAGVQHTMSGGKPVAQQAAEKATEYMPGARLTRDAVQGQPHQSGIDPRFMRYRGG
jgi:hypothetical protein